VQDYLLSPIDASGYDHDENYWRLFLHLRRYISMSKKFNFSYMFNGTMVFADDVFIGDYYRPGGEMAYKSYVIPLSGFRFMEFTD